jgi:hypothetical protein
MRPFCDILETTVFLAAIPGRDWNRKPLQAKGAICGSQSRPEDRGAATMVAIGVLLKEFAAARNRHYL